MAAGAIPRAVNRVDILSEQARGERSIGASKSELILVAGALLAALLLRVFMLRFGGELTGDGVWYTVLGKNLVEGDFRGGLSTYWSPLYPLLIGITSLCFGDLELSGRLVSVVAGSLLVIPVYLLARRLYGKAEAGIAALLTTISPPLIFSSTRVLSESLFTLLFTLGVLAALRALTQKRIRFFFLAGAAFGACYLVKPEAIGFGGLIVVAALSRRLISKQGDTRSVVAGAVLAAVGFAALALPYILYLRSETGKWTVSEKLTSSFGTSGGSDKWRGLIEGGETTMADKLWGGQRSSAVTEEAAAESRGPSSTPRVTLQLPPPMSVVRNLYREYGHLFEMMTPLFFFLVGMGIVGTRWSPERAGKEVCLLVFVASMLFGYACAGFEKRYIEALFPILIVWSSRGLVGLEHRLCAIERGVRRSAALLDKHRIALRALLLVCVAASFAPSLRSGATVEDDALKEIALWMKRDSEPGAPLIMASTPLFAFYAAGKHLYTPSEGYDLVVDYARRKGTDYLVVEEAAIRLTPKLSFLLDDDQSHPGLNLVHRDDTLERKVRVFKLDRSQQGATPELVEAPILNVVGANLH
jgi:4-amino-4-deoxy-L-arabinose transferase-like glycosyltransferase